MSSFTVRKCGFWGFFSEKKKQFRVKSVTLVIIRDAYRYREETFSIEY